MALGTCAVNQELSNGFCYDVCQVGYTGQDARCVKDCAPGFVDHGLACERPSILRTPVKAFLAACAEGQYDVNGDCFEPQTVAWYNKISGCGCVRVPFAQRLQCPSSQYRLYNNSCVTACPDGYEDILDSDGNITSLYCMQRCPPGSTTLGGLCVKESFPRLPHKIVSNVTTPVFTLPENMASVLANAPGGQTLGSRYQANFTIQQNLMGGNSSPPGSGDSAWSSWNDLFLSPGALTLFIIIMGAIFFGGPELFPLIASGFGAIINGLGSLFGGELSGAGSLIKSSAAGAGKIIEGTASGAGSLIKSSAAGAGKIIEGTASGVGSVIASTGRGAGSLIQNTAQTLGNIENAVGRDVSAEIATPGANLAARNARAPIDAETAALQQLELAQAALNRVRQQKIADLNS